MPYGRRRSYRRVRGRRPYGRRSTRGTNYVRSISSGIKMARRAWTLASRLRRLVNVEIKKYDAAVSAGTGITSTGSSYPLHEMAQGDTDQLRNGNSIKPLYLRLVMNFVNNSTAVNTRVRYLIIRDMQQVPDTSPAVSDVLDGSVASYCDAPLNNLAVGRYKILRDSVVTMTSVSRPVVNIKLNEKLYGHIRYNGSASTDIQKGGLYLLVVSDQATNTPTFGFNLRLSFTDN